MNRLIHKFHDLGGIGSVGHLLFGQLGFVHLGHERDSSKVLPQAVVQILADAALLTSADVEQRSLQLLAFSDVDAGGDDVVGCSVVGRAAWSRTRQSGDAYCAA